MAQKGLSTHSLVHAPPGAYQRILLPNYASAVPAGLVAAGLMSVTEASLSQKQNENIKTPGVKPEGKIKWEEN